jgi:hypothetical protein
MDETLRKAVARVRNDKTEAEIRYALGTVNDCSNDAKVYQVALQQIEDEKGEVSERRVDRRHRQSLERSDRALCLSKIAIGLSVAIPLILVAVEHRLSASKQPDSHSPLPPGSSHSGHPTPVPDETAAPPTRTPQKSPPTPHSTEEPTPAHPPQKPE